ncbi:MAG: PQQ-binding-like beta-propeller repeat protein [Pseudomonadota bacterium]
MRYLSLFSLIALLTITACSSSEDYAPPLPGERISILDLQKELIASPSADLSEEIALPRVYKNAFWPQAGGYPSHVMQNLSLNEGELKRAWSADIGEGSGRIPLTAQPIVADGKVFTLDTRAKLRAFDSTNGKRIWETKVKPENEDEAVIGGGTAFSDGTLYVTSGYNEALAVNPENGEIVWRTKLVAPARAAPTVLQGRAFLTLLNNTVVALNAGNGKILWEHNSIGESAGLLGAASPAADREIVVPGLSSGDILALRVENGALAWQDNLAGRIRFGSLSGLADIRALPVLEGDLILAVSYGGKMVALDKPTGNRLWERNITGSETPWIAANAVYVLTTDNELIALDKTNGAVYWITELKRFENEKKNEGKVVWTGPVMAGNRLIVAGSRGRLAEIDPKTGAVIRESKKGGDIRISPVVANNTLYLLSENGTLSAYR